MIKLYLIFLSNLLFSKCLIFCSTVDWGYKSSPGIKGPSEWKDIYPTCGGSLQSPLDIQSDKVQYNKNMKPIIIKKGSTSLSLVGLEKHPTSLYLSFNDYWSISFGGEKCLKPVAIHWHWGSTSKQGSEHIINGYSHPIEGHLVSYNCELYSSMAAAQNALNGLYVIGIFYNLGSENAAIKQIISGMGPILNNSITSVNISEIGLDVILPSPIEKYYQYDGSLTAPPCTENVKWTLIKEELSISSAQLNAFRKLSYESPLTGSMEDNFRPPILNTNNRIIYASFQVGIALTWNKIVVYMHLTAVVIYSNI